MIRRKQVLVLGAIALACLVMFTLLKDRESMEEPFENLWKKSLTARGDEYRQVRNKILALSAEEAAPLERKSQNPEWHARLQAEIFKAWRQDAKRCEYVRGVARGVEPSLRGEKYVTGKPPIDLSVAELDKNGPANVPVLLEMLYKEPESADDYVFTVATEALIKWNEKSAIPVYRALLLDSTIIPPQREESIRPLLALKAEKLFDVLFAVHEDKNNPLELRATSLAALGSIRDPRVATLLRNTLANGKAELRFRCAAAQGMGSSKDPVFIDPLAQEYGKDSAYDLKESILMALGALDDPRAIAPLARIQKTEKAPGLVERLDRLIEDLEERRE